VIHRDIKPGNILPRNRRHRVNDFGISFSNATAGRPQITGVGSPAHVSRTVRWKTTHQTDVIQLAACRLLTGRLPYEANTQAALTYSILNTVPARPVTLRPDLSPLLDQIVMKAIEKDRAARYQTWLDFGKDLSQAFSTLRLSGASASDSEKFNQLRDMAFFEDFDDVSLWEVVRIGSWQTMEAETVLIKEADQGDSFYVLVNGEVGVTLLGKQLNVIKPGGCFGEILYFTGRMGRRTTTITALGEVTVMEIKADALRVATAAAGQVQQGVHAGAGGCLYPG
jgi:serine/threonine protein kinase